MFFSVFHATLLGVLLLATINSLLLLKRKGFFAITGILLFNLITEFYVEHVLAHGVYNHYIYALNSLGVAFFLLNYFRLNINSQLFSLVCASLFFLFLYTYIHRRMWEPGLVIPVNIMAVYYAALSLLSLFFVWCMLITGRKDENYSLRFGICFLLYYLMAFLNFSPEFALLLNPADKDYFFWAFNVLNLIYYSVLGVLLLQYRLSGKQHVS